MEDIRSFIESGIIESYALGMANEEEILRVESMASLHPEVKQELEEIRSSLESYAGSHASKPHMTLKPMVLGGIEYMERMMKGEPPSYPPVIYEGSKIEDYREWLDRPDMMAPEEFDNIHAKYICITPELKCAIVWIKEIAPDEVHKDEHERFLIVEGTCDIYVDGHVRHLVPGDVFFVPLHSNHHVIITSDIPCKAVLQRIAA
jgi:mannose-6-phosphate isomerase-like protein (cupin superfamily)